MPKYVVGHIDWFDHELTLEIIDAPTWREAWAKHSKFPWTENDGPSADLASAQQACFDCDCMMSHIEVAP
jgi:hypothetical protein